MNIRNIIIVLAITLVSCSEPTPQELREQARQMVKIAEVQEKKIAREEAIRKAQYRQTPRDAIKKCQNSSNDDSHLFYLDGHKYRMWWGSHGHREHMAVVHDPECEMNDVRKIVRP